MLNKKVMTAEEKAMKNRKLKIGTVATLITVGVVVAIVIFNVLLNVIVELFPVKIDATTEKVYQLSADAVDYLTTIDKKIELIVVQDMDDLENTMKSVLPNNYKDNYLSELFSNFAKYSDNITVKNVKPTVEPVFFTERNIKISSTSIMVVYCSETNRHKLIDVSDILYKGNGSSSTSLSLDAERAITSAIIYVAKDEIRNIAILTDHECDKGDYLQQFFATNGFEVNAVSLSDSEAFDENTAALVIINPMHDFSEADIAALKTFMQHDNNMRQYNLGRTLYVFLDNNAPSLPNFYSFLKEYCITPVDEYVIDTSKTGSATYSYTSNGTARQMTVISAAMPFETIGKNITKKVIALEQYTKSFKLNELGTGESISSIDAILQTSENAYTKPLTADDMSFDNSNDSKSVRVIGALAKRSYWNVPEQKRYDGYVAVIGDAMVASKSFMGSTSYGNSDFMKDLVNETIGDDSIEISVMPRDLSAETLKITSRSVYTALCIIIFIPPVLLLVGAGFVYFKRRHM